MQVNIPVILFEIMITWREYIEAEDTSSRREYGRMCSGITLLRQGRALLAMLPNENFRVLSSGFTNGGVMESPEAVVNVTGMGGQVEYDVMKGGLDENDACGLTYAKKLGLDPSKTVLLGTAANMDNAAVRSIVSDDGICISAAITAGIDHNGGRSGDPATYDESVARHVTNSGTIITIMVIDADLSEGALFQAMLMAAEAKSCVIQELQARSLYSRSIATGSGTDQVAVISNTASGNKIESIDRSSHLAHAIADCIKQALPEAFERQAGMDAKRQWDPFMQMKRYGVGVETMHDDIRQSATMKEIEAALDKMHTDRQLAATVSVILGIADDVSAGLIRADSGLDAAKRIAERMLIRDLKDPAELLRFGSFDDIPKLLSYSMAIRLKAVIEEGRCADAE